jgi:hypothetical protein
MRVLPVVPSVLLALVAAAPTPAAPPAVPGTGTALGVVELRTQRAIRDDPKVAATVRVRGADGPGYEGRGAVELRGQSSQSFAKKSYALELRDAGGEDRAAPLLGMPADADWVLQAAHADKSLMRNVVGYEAARRTGRWAAQTRWVELRLNGRYQGVYVLMERPELDDERLDAPRGAALLELTFPFQARDKGRFLTTPVRRRPIVLDDGPRRASIRPAVRGLERALYRGGWRSRLDEAAAVDYVLVQELMRNVDAFHASTFFVQAPGRKVVLGPVWDLDLSTGNSTYRSSRATSGWWTRERDWAERLWADRGFRSRLAARWRALQREGYGRAVLAGVDRHQALLAAGAAGRNFRRWPVLSRRVFQEPVLRGSFGAEARFLRAWLARRMAWMDRATRP